MEVLKFSFLVISAIKQLPHTLKLTSKWCILIIEHPDTVGIQNWGIKNLLILVMKKQAEG